MATTPDRQGGPTRVAVLHPGEMGAAVGAALVDLGHEVVWLPQGRSMTTRDRADRAGLTAAGDLTTCHMALSICPPVDASAVAAEALGPQGFRGLYVDANAISPGVSAQLAGLAREAGVEYVDGSIIGGPPTAPGSARLYLSGRRAPQVAELFAGARLEPRVLDGSPFAASGLKMCFATGTKIRSATLLAARAAADRLGVAGALDAEWTERSLDGGHGEAVAAATAKGWRWAGEMDQIAATFAELGLPAGFGEAASEIYRDFPRPDPSEPSR